LTLNGFMTILTHLTGFGSGSPCVCMFLCSVAVLSVPSFVLRDKPRALNRVLSFNLKSNAMLYFHLKNQISYATGSEDESILVVINMKNNYMIQ
jgi:hypothetical protein